MSTIKEFFETHDPSIFDQSTVNFSSSMITFHEGSELEIQKCLELVIYQVQSKGTLVFDGNTPRQKLMMGRFVLHYPYGEISDPSKLAISSSEPSDKNTYQILTPALYVSDKSNYIPASFLESENNSGPEPFLSEVIYEPNISRMPREVETRTEAQQFERDNLIEQIEQNIEVLVFTVLAKGTLEQDIHHESHPKQTLQKNLFFFVLPHGELREDLSYLQISELSDEDDSLVQRSVTVYNDKSYHSTYSLKLDGVAELASNAELEPYIRDSNNKPMVPSHKDFEGELNDFATDNLRLIRDFLVEALAAARS